MTKTGSPLTSTEKLENLKENYQKLFVLGKNLGETNLLFGDETYSILAQPNLWKG